MRRADLHFDLPEALIAQQPVEPRDASRLLVLERRTGTLEHRRFSEVGDYLRPGDCLIVNDTRVVPARFFCHRSTGGKIEGLFLHAAGGQWRVLLKPSGKLKVGERIGDDSGRMQLELVARHERGEWEVRPEPAVEPLAWLEHVGQTPLPPYIHRAAGPKADDADQYQTVYARVAGAIAAPTAGLHFTPQLLTALLVAGVERAAVTLHVGLGTFQPVVADDLAEHPMHAEWYTVSAETVAQLNRVRAAGGRIIAVGTTATRVLESLPLTLGDARVTAGHSGWTDIFIYPPYQYRNVDALLTNFHLPESTLIALVMAFASPEQVRAAYAAAIAERYRFYSYGDAMLVV